MSNIPDFDHNNVLPPHIGDPTRPEHVSPYDCSVTEFCNKFATSKIRIEILIGFLEFRLKIYDLGIVNGFQWLDGSFTENIEKAEKRDPRDIDVLTFYDSFTNPDAVTIITTIFKEFYSSALSKSSFKVDHYPIHYSYNPLATVEITRYWVQLFSHNRNGTWKGMVSLKFENRNEDENILAQLKQKL